MEFINASIVAFAPVVTAFLEAVVKPFMTNEKYCPVVSIGLGLLVGLAFYLGSEVDPVTCAVSGVVLGLSASGFYSVVSSIKK